MKLSSARLPLGEAGSVLQHIASCASALKKISANLLLPVRHPAVPDVSPACGTGPVRVLRKRGGRKESLALLAGAPPLAHPVELGPGEVCGGFARSLLSKYFM